MPGTDSEWKSADSARYQFQFGVESPYGHAVSLVEQLSLGSGVVLDIGCGFGAVAEPLAKLGLEYVGCDIDKDALDDLRSRGFKAFDVDLTAHEDLAELIKDNLSDTQIHDVKVALLLDVLEHLPSTHEVLSSLRKTLIALGSPVLIVSVPNIAHIDIGAKLAFGRFDYTRTGLLDNTHLSFFSEARLIDKLADVGLRQIAKNDFSLRESDQHFPVLHPAMAPKAPLARLLRHWRSQVDESANVNQFIRAFAAIPMPDGPRKLSLDTSAAVFLSVLMRTQGSRPDCLSDSLTCLAAQTTDDFEVKLLVHADNAMVEKVQGMLGHFHPTFSHRVDVIQVVGGGRARPLNVGLERARGKYIAFLDDDDLVTGDWVQTFRSGSEDAQGQIVRSVTVNQRIEHVEEESLAPYRVVSGLEGSFMPTFDLGLHFHRNQSPICSFAVPHDLVEAFKLRFDEELPVTEDWDFLFRAAQLAGVHDTKKATSIYRRWVGADGSEGVVDQTVWDGVRRSILHRFDQVPLILPPGNASKMAEYRELDATVKLVEFRNLVADTERLCVELDQLRTMIEGYEKEIEGYVKEIEGYENSVSWKVTRPVRILLHHLRRVISKIRASE